MEKRTTDMLEGMIQDNLLLMQGLYFGDEEETKRRSKILSETETLIDKLTVIEKDNMEYWDKEKRRELEEQKNETMASIESEKQKITWKRVVFEIAKVAVPTGMSLIGYGIFQGRLMKFEETGRVTSTAGRELHLPKIFR